MCKDNKYNYNYKYLYIQKQRWGAGGRKGAYMQKEHGPSHPNSSCHLPISW